MLPLPLRGSCEKIQVSKPGWGDVGKNVERLPFPDLFTKMQRAFEINNLESFKTIKLNARILHFWRYSPILAAVPPIFFTALGG
jgi:hypothetical protein